MATRRTSRRSKPKLDAALLRAHKAYETAINTNDTEVVMAMYDKDAAQMPPDGPTTNGWNQLRAAVEGYFSQYKTRWKKVVQKNWVSGDFGFDQGIDTAVDVPRSGRGPTIHWKCKGILVYKRQKNGEWLVFRDIWNNITPPKTTKTKTRRR
jgi:ketosteroid isomerase-like protein